MVVARQVKSCPRYQASKEAVFFPETAFFICGLVVQRIVHESPELRIPVRFRARSLKLQILIQSA